MTLTVIHAAVAAFLAVAALWDAKTAKIPNWLIYVGLGLFVIKAIFVPETIDFAWQIALAVIVFVAGFALFTTGAIGAGAVKLMSVAALFMPLDRLGVIGLTLVGAIILSLIVFGFLRTMFGHDDHGWACLQRRIIPMAVPIGITAAVGLFVV